MYRLKQILQCDRGFKLHSIKGQLAGRIRRKKCLRGPQKSVKRALISHKPVIVTIIKEFFMTKRAAQSLQAGHVFETPAVRHGLMRAIILGLFSTQAFPSVTSSGYKNTSEMKIMQTDIIVT